MKLYSLILSFLFFSNILFSQQLNLTLDDCIELALKNNENLKKSILEEIISKAVSK